MSAKEQTTSTREFPQENKKMTSPDKLDIYKDDIQITKLSGILEVELTSRDPASSKYWNSLSEEISKRLWYPQVTDFPDTEPKISLHGCSQDLTQDLSSWIPSDSTILKRNSLTTCWKLSQSSPQDITACENTVTRKIEFLPTAEQKSFIHELFGAHNYFYNATISFIKNNPDVVRTVKNLRQYVSTKHKVIKTQREKYSDCEWMLRIPVNTRDYAIGAAITAEKTAKTLLKRGFIKHFDLKLRTKKKSENICRIEHTFLKNGDKFFVDTLKFPYIELKNKRYFQYAEDRYNLRMNENAFTISEKDGKYYINVCCKRKLMHSIIKEKSSMCALDPGQRTFQTMYAEDGIAKFGTRVSTRLAIINNRIDEITATFAEARGKLFAKKRYRMKRRCSLLRAKIRNIVDELHKKTCNYLTNNYQVILLPIFSTKRMVSRDGPLTPMTKRLLMDLRHFDFRQRLLNVAKIRGRTVIVCNEHYTSRTCGICGTINENLGGNKIFSCDVCQSVADRDIHAARNIFIRSLTKYYSDGTAHREATDDSLVEQ